MPTLWSILLLSPTKAYSINEGPQLNTILTDESLRNIIIIIIIIILQ
jgi:hypothetical protein